MFVHGTGLPIDFVRPETETQWRIYAAYYWELENICLFQQAAHATVASRNERLDTIAAENRAIDHSASIRVLADDDEREMAMIAKSRRWDRVRAEECTLNTIEAFNAELTTISIWTVVEKNLLQMLTAIEAAADKPITKTIHFEALQRRFISCGVDVRALSGFADVDECRCVNNVIKHGGTIGSSLARFPDFAALNGKPIRREILDVQKYLFAAYNFLGGVLAFAL
jgi:hypothetical protein